MNSIMEKLASGQRFPALAALLLGGLAFSAQFSYADPPEKEGFVLISEDDFEIWTKESEGLQVDGEEPEVLFEDKFTLVEDAPKIIILEPGAAAEESEELLSPIDFIMKFEPQGEATIDLDSIRVHYKYLGWQDITDKILEHAEITEEGIRALKAEIPKGKHKMRLKVKDSLGREARAVIVFRIAS